MSKDQLAHSVELQELVKRFTRLVDTPEGMRKIEEAAVTIQVLKNQDGRDGFIQLNPTEESLDEPVYRSWVEAAVSNDPERAQAWVLSRLAGAIFEFSFDPSLEQTSDGVRVQTLPRRAISKPDAEE
jgi:hypothetical protein